jgi:HAD superfamily hydrolase (TIGR01509 family)
LKEGPARLVVTDGFYEWKKPEKQPYADAMANESHVVMAGLWDEWTDKKTGERIKSCTIRHLHSTPDVPLGESAMDEAIPKASFLFDLDGTLVDSVYQHVLAWREALDVEGINVAVWRIHRKIGMSGGLFTDMLLRETGFHIDPERRQRLRNLHAAAFNRQSASIRPLPGARELIGYLTHAGIPWAIATSGRMETARPVLEMLDVDFDRTPIVTRDQVKHAKPDPDLFVAAAARLGIRVNTATVVGDSVWDMLAAQRARALGVGLLSGGYSQDELERAGAYRVYEDPADLLKHIDEVGVRR